MFEKNKHLNFESTKYWFFFSVLSKLPLKYFSSVIVQFYLSITLFFFNNACPMVNMTDVKQKSRCLFWCVYILLSVFKFLYYSLKMIGTNDNKNEKIDALCFTFLVFYTLAFFSMIRIPNIYSNMKEDIFTLFLCLY